MLCTHACATHTLLPIALHPGAYLNYKPAALSGSGREKDEEKKKKGEKGRGKENHYAGPGCMKGGGTARGMALSTPSPPMGQVIGLQPLAPITWVRVCSGA